MGHPQKVARLPWDTDLIDAFAPSIHANPWGFGRAHEVLHQSEAFEFSLNGQQALVAVRPVRRLDGIRLDVVALVSTGDRLRATNADDALLQIASMYQADQLAMSTMRPHIAKLAQRTGWQQTGVLMIKKLGTLQ